MRKAAVLVVLLLLCQSAYSQATKEWVRVAPPNSGFVVMMPEQPKEEKDVKESFTSHLFSVTTKNMVYLAIFGDYAPSVRFDPQKELELNRDNLNKGVKATLLTSNQYNIDGRLGLEFTSETPKATLKSRVFVVGNRVIQLATMVSKGSDEQRNVDKFLDSFAFTTK